MSDRDDHRTRWFRIKAGEGDCFIAAGVEAVSRYGNGASDFFIAMGQTAEKLTQLTQLTPVFRPDGEITAGNACPLNDGAAAVLVMSAPRAPELGLTPLVRIVSSRVTGLNPEIMGLGPIGASRMAMERAGMSADASTSWRSTRRSAHR